MMPILILNVWFEIQNEKKLSGSDIIHQGNGFKLPAFVSECTKVTKSLIFVSKYCWSFVKWSNAINIRYIHDCHDK